MKIHTASNMPKTDLLTIIPKPKQEVPKRVNICLLVCAGVFIALLVCLFVFMAESSSWQKKKAATETQLSSLNTEQNKNLEDQVWLIAKKIKKFSQIFGLHKNSFRFFDFLRQNCHPRVRFFSLNLSTDKGGVILDGLTDTYKSLSEQITILKTNSQISDFQVANISLSKEGSIAFQISFTLNGQVLSPQNK